MHSHSENILVDLVDSTAHQHSVIVYIVPYRERDTSYSINIQATGKNINELQCITVVPMYAFSKSKKTATACCTSHCVLFLYTCSFSSGVSQ